MCNELENKKEDFKTYLSYFSEGLTIVFLTAFLYILCYFYELGYCFFYDIPNSLISIEIRSLLYTAVLLLGILMLLLPVFAIYFIFREFVFNKASSFHRKIFLLWLCAIMFGLYTILTTTHFRGIFVVIIIFLLAWFFDLFLLPRLHIFLQNKTLIYRRYRNLENFLTAHVEHYPNDFSIGCPPRYHRWIYLGCTVFLITWCMFLYGYMNGPNDKYYVLENCNKKWIVLRIYGEKVVCAEYDQDKKIIYRRMKVLKIEDTGEFYLKTTGYLKFDKGS